MKSQRLSSYVFGCVNRTIYAVLFAMLGWYSCVFPPGFAWQTGIQRALCYSLTYPLALIGRLTQPYRGLDVFFDRGGEWCDFCSAQQVLWYHLRFAVPVYVVLFYLPTLFRWIARRNFHLFCRIVMGLLIYAAMTTAFFLVTGGNDRSGDIRVAGIWLLILAAASAFAWSKLDLTRRAVGVLAVVFVGAWAMPFQMTFIAPKTDVVRINDYIAYVFVVLTGVTLLLGLTWCLENGVERMRKRRTADG